jgi:hypothetical protein
MRRLAGHLFWLGLWRFLDASSVVRAPPHMARGRFSGNHVGHGELFRATERLSALSLDIKTGEGNLREEIATECFI